MRRILDILGDFRARTVRRASGEGLVHAVGACAGLVLVAGVLLGLRPDLVPRTVLAAIVLGMPAVLFARAVVRGYATFPDDHAAARYLETALPELRTDVRTALDFGATDAPEDPLAASMRAAQLARAERALHTVRSALPGVVPRRSLRRPLTVLALISLVLAVVAATWEPFGTGLRQAAVEVAAAVEPDRKPLITTIDLHIEHPAHTGMYPTRVFGSTGDIRAMVGSTVTLTARPLVEVESASISLEGELGQRVALRTELDGRLVGRIQITESASYQFHVTTADGQTLVDPRERRIFVTPDHPPTVELSHPPADLEVTPEQIVDFQYAARDDFGVAEVAIGWHFVGDPEGVRFEQLQTELSTPTFEEHVPFDLTPLRLHPRDEVVVYVQATDNNTIDGPGVGASRSITLRVGSPDDRNLEVLAQKEALFEGLLRQLGGSLTADMTRVELNDERELVHRPGRADEVDRAASLGLAREVHERWIPTIEVFEGLLVLMREDELTLTRDLEMLEGAYESLYATVLDQGRQLDKSGAQPSADGVPDRSFVEAAIAFGDTIAATERTTVLLQDLVATHKADNVRRAMEELERTRDELRSLIEAYRDAPSDELREQIMQEMRRLQARMRELMEQLASQVEDLPTEHLNADAIDQSELADSLTEMTTAMEQLERMLESNDIDGALDLLEQLEAELDAVSQELSPLGDAQPDTLSEFDREMGAMMDELNNLAALEGELEAETQALLDEMLTERAHEIEAESRAALEDALRRVERELERYRGLDTERLSADTQRIMGEVEAGMERLRDRLQQADPSASEDAATRVISQLSDALWELVRDQSLLVVDEAGRRDADRAQETSRRADGVVREVRDEMRELMEMAQPTPNEAQREAMRHLSQEQQMVQDRLGELGQSMQEMGQRFPSVQGQLEPTLERASESMQQARDELQTGRPRPALQGEASALEAMQQMREQMRQMTQQQRQRQQRDGRRNPDDVEIPEGASAGREDFRDAVLEAMREDVLEDYQEEIRQYYESLLE